MIIGHSFGGKVALLAGKYIECVTQVWMLDCPPGPVCKIKMQEADTSKTSLEIIEILRRIDWPVSSRKSLMEILESFGVDKPIAAWMTTNLKNDSDGIRLVFEPDELHQMLLDFINLDLWPELIANSDRMQIHLLAAEHGGRVRTKIKKKYWLIRAMAREFFIYCHVLGMLYMWITYQD